MTPFLLRLVAFLTSSGLLPQIQSPGRASSLVDVRGLINKKKQIKNSLKKLKTQLHQLTFWLTCFFAYDLFTRKNSRPDLQNDILDFIDKLHGNLPVLFSSLHDKITYRPSWKKKIIFNMNDKSISSQKLIVFE